MKSISPLGVILAVAAIASALFLGACAAQPEQTAAQRQASAQAKDDAEDITTGSRLKGKSNEPRADVKSSEGPIQSIGGQGMKGN